MATVGGVVVLDHPFVHHLLARLRDERTEQREFAQAVDALTRVVAHEVLRGVSLRSTRVNTPVATAVSVETIDEAFLIVPILRAGLGMLAALASVLPDCSVAFVGVRRDEHTLEPDVYLDGLPGRIGERHVVVCDPMLATGGSVGAVVDRLETLGADRISVACLIASAPGIEQFGAAHPGVGVVVAAIDADLNGNGFIVPGLGDAGDRLFGTVT